MKNIHFDSSFVDNLPADPVQKNYRREVTGACYSFTKPKKTRQPSLITYSEEVANLLEFSKTFCETEMFTQIFSGNKAIKSMQPYAMCYGGHQFGNWAGQLGDGRAINLGEITNSKKESWTLQLKGAGETPYSRGADGLAVLRSSVREFLCSEAMFHLGVPTTRALSLITTGDNVLRDMFYDGNVKLEPGAIVCRVAPNFLRFGNFELLASRGESILLEHLINYTIENYFEEFKTPKSTTTNEKVERYATWFHEICKRTAVLICDWMRFGFVHGVMNTDNMSISGLTIDYGPYGWLEGYDPMWTPNTTDAQGKRYCYGRHPDIGLWNLVQLANALYSVAPDEDALKSGLELYRQTYAECWRVEMGKKLGFVKAEKEDDSLIENLMLVLGAKETDWTLFFRLLSKLDIQEKPPNTDDVIQQLEPAFYDSVKSDKSYLNSIENWIKKYHSRSLNSGLSNFKRTSLMDSVNPKYILRNYIAQIAIDKATDGDFSTIIELLQVLKEPFSEQADYEQKYAKRRPEWARKKAGCSMLSCSS